MSALSLNPDTSDERKTFFVDVILPVPIPRLFTYRVPAVMNNDLAVGGRVIAPFGKRRIITGIIGKIHETPPKGYEAKYIEEVLDDAPIVFPVQIELMRWMAEYYMCTIGEALNVALPSGLKVSSESRIQINPEFEPEEFAGELSDKEWDVLKAAQKKESLTYRDIEEALTIKNFNHVIKSLLQKNAIIIYEQVKEKYAPKKVKRIRLRRNYIGDKPKMEELFKTLEKRPKQLDILMKYLQEAPVYRDESANEKGVEKQLFNQPGLSYSALNTLIKNQVFEEFTTAVSRFEYDFENQENVIELAPEQAEARDQILELFSRKDIVLLHGITGSGKTEIYVDLIKKVLEGESQALYLLPEIAITTQIVTRLRKIFGEKLGVYHSRFSDNERVEVWRGVLEGRYSFVVGVRSAVFLPFNNLSLIVVDEEHENSYKQFDPAPRYHARDTALMLARMHHAKVLLGSATPAVESYHHALEGRYGLVELHKRYGKAGLPEIVFADLREDRKQKKLKGEFTEMLTAELNGALERNEQAIVFQNRRGYAPHVSCDECAWIPKCEQCDVSLTYHQFRNELRCHYCGYSLKLPPECLACGSPKIRSVGYGTEKLEEDLKLHLGNAKVRRMDLDTTRKKYSYQAILEEFEKGDIDILVGTQMVSKGLDFDRVSLVGILDVDRMIHFPDFRSFERAFQLVTQVSGRAGRRENTGRVIIQTANMKQPILYRIQQNDYRGFFDSEIAERKKFGYPPFVRLIRITLKHEDKKTVDEAARILFSNLSQALGRDRVLGPEEALIPRLRNLYLMQIMVKIERDQNISVKKAKEVMKQATDILLKESAYKKLSIVFDVDPY